MQTVKETWSKLKDSINGEDLYKIAQCYEPINQFGNPNPSFNNFRRLYWYLKAGKLGYADAYNNLAFIIEHDLKIKNREKRFIEYYRKASELGSDLGKENYNLSIKQLKK